MYPLQVYIFMFYLVGTGLVLGLMVGLLYFNKEVRVKLLRILTRKNYGIVYFVTRKSIFSTIANLGNNIYRYKNRLFVFKDKYIYILKPQVVKGVNLYKLAKKKLPEKELKDYLIAKIEVDAKHVKQTLIGVPVIFFNFEDIAPIDIETGKSDEKFRDSRFVAGILDQEIEVERKKAMVSESKKRRIENILMLVAIGILGIMLVVLYFKTNAITAKLNEIFTLVNQTANMGVRV